MRRVVPPRLASARDSKSLPASDRHIEAHPARARASRARDATRNDGDRRAVVHGRRRATANGSARVLRREIEELEVRLRDKTQNLRRLEAQRNELNGRGARSAREKGVVVVDRASAVRERTRKRDERNDRGEIANAARTTSED